MYSDYHQLWLNLLRIFPCAKNCVIVKLLNSGVVVLIKKLPSKLLGYSLPAKLFGAIFLPTMLRQ